MAGQLMRLAETAAEPVHRFNPRPPGVVHDGSATDAVLRVLKANPQRYFTYAELRSRCPGYSHAAMSWGLIRARRFDLVQVIGDESRNPRYQRYRIKCSV
jgi:hypothetical protein